MSYYKLRAVFLKSFRLQPSEMDSLPYYEIEILLDILTESVEEENARYKEEEAKQQTMYSSPNYKTPSMPKINMPSMPKF